MPKFVDEHNPFNGPIPGQSLTAEPGSRPWEMPPKFVDPDEAVDFMLNRISQPDTAQQLFALLEADVSIKAITTSLVLSGFTEGMFSPDVAMLVAGPVAGFIKVMASDAGIKAKVGDEEDKQFDVTLAKIKSVREATPEEMPEEAMENTDMGTGLLSPVSEV